jgi:hypothetical protein
MKDDVDLGADELSDEGEANAKLQTQSSKPASEDKQAKLVNRVTQVLKSGCGVEVVNESSTVNSFRHRSHIALAMFSGMNVIFGSLKEEEVFGVEVEEKNHYYELLINPDDLMKMLEMTGQVGFVDSAEVANANSEANNSDAADKKKKKKKNDVKSLINDLLGTQAVASSMKLSRGKWSHLAVVSTESPQNRVLFYLVSRW